MVKLAPLGPYLVYIIGLHIIALVMELSLAHQFAQCFAEKRF